MPGLSNLDLTGILLVFLVTIGLPFLIWVRRVIPTFRRHEAVPPAPTNPIEYWRQLQTFRRLCREHGYGTGTYWVLVVLNLLINVLGVCILLFAATQGSFR